MLVRTGPLWVAGKGGMAKGRVHHLSLYSLGQLGTRQRPRSNAWRVDCCQGVWHGAECSELLGPPGGQGLVVPAPTHCSADTPGMASPLVHVFPCLRGWAPELEGHSWAQNGSRFCPVL